MKTLLRDGEVVLKEGAANLQKGMEMVGGRLFLTSQRLIFEAHRFNVQRGVTEQELAAVVGVSTGWSRLFGLIPLLPNLLCVSLHQGAALQLVVYGRADWCQAIRRQLG